MMKLWNDLPQWLRQTLKESAESILVVVLTYGISVIQGQIPFDFVVLEGLVLKTLFKTVRSNPNIPVPDYVNKDQ